MGLRQEQLNFDCVVSGKINCLDRYCGGLMACGSLLRTERAAKRICINYWKPEKYIGCLSRKDNQQNALRDGPIAVVSAYMPVLLFKYS